MRVIRTRLTPGTAKIRFVINLIADLFSKCLHTNRRIRRANVIIQIKVIFAVISWPNHITIRQPDIFGITAVANASRHSQITTDSRSRQ
jgi:hypothetical protein